MAHRILDWLADSPVSRATDFVLIPVGLSLPIWHEYLREMSDWFALGVPIATFILLILKIYATIRDRDSED